MPADRLEPHRAAFGLADHGDKAGPLEHHLGELVHPGGGRRASRPNHLIAHRVHWAHVIDHPVREFDARWQPLAAGVEVGDAFVRGVAAGEQFAAEQQAVTGFP